MTVNEAINELIQCYSFNASEKKNEAISMAIKALEEQRWIFVTERLPEVGQRVLVTTKDGFIDIRKCIDAGHLAWFYSNIIAWMPYNLPEPYQKRSE
jgi:hypothetical protein